MKKFLTLLSFSAVLVSVAHADDTTVGRYTQNQLVRIISQHPGCSVTLSDTVQFRLVPITLSNGDSEFFAEIKQQNDATLVLYLRKTHFLMGGYRMEAKSGLPYGWSVDLSVFFWGGYDFSITTSQNGGSPLTGNGHCAHDLTDF